MGGTFSEQSLLLKNILNLGREPIGVKFLSDIQNFPSINDYEQIRKLRYCQAIMAAGKGKRVLLSSRNIACAAAGAAFGLMPLHPKIASGEGHYNTGVFGSRESAAKIMKELPRIEQGAFQYIAIAPLGESEWLPDVIVIEARPEAIMWLSLAEIYNSGTRLQYSTSIVQACCVDATVVPFLTGKPNASFGCTGCREATDLDTDEAIMGFPGQHLEIILNNLKLLLEKTIPKNRKKTIYARLTEGSE